MPIESFWVRNYKAFGQRTDIEVRPLTLLFGYNSVGKSALLRVLPLLSESTRLSTSADTNPLALTSDAARGATFEDLRCQFTDSPVVSFGLGWRGDDINGISFSIRDLPELRRQIVERVRYFRNRNEEASFDWALPSDSDRAVTADRYVISAGDRRFEDTRIRFRGLLPDASDLSSITSPTRNLVEAELDVRRYLTHIHWLKALSRLLKK